MVNPETRFPGLMVHCVEGHRSVSQSASALMSAVNQQPVSVAVSVNLAFSSCKSGVFTADCPTKLNHAVLLVGFGTEGGNTDWLVKNSWCTRWGQGRLVLVEASRQLRRGSSTDRQLWSLLLKK